MSEIDSRTWTGRTQRASEEPGWLHRLRLLWANWQLMMWAEWRRRTAEGDIRPAGQVRRTLESIRQHNAYEAEMDRLERIWSRMSDGDLQERAMLTRRIDDLHLKMMALGVD